MKAKNEFKRTLILMLLVMVMASAAEVNATTMNYIGNWLAMTTYALGNVVVLNKQTFYSLAGNKNKNPVTAKNYWRAIGTVGNTIFNGAAAPVLKVGNVGDFYIDTKNHRLYGPKTTTWPTTYVSMVGPRGLTGSFPYSMTCGISGTDACKIGAVGPGGGWIFFVDYNDQYPGFTYLEAAPTDIATVIWCNYMNSSIPAVADWASKGVGKGQVNTTAMLGVCSSGAATEADLYLTAKSDWFLPSLGEAKLMYDNLLEAGVGSFAYTYYWSSSEYDSYSAWSQNFKGGDQFSSYVKYMRFPVRAVRSF